MVKRWDRIPRVLTRISFTTRPRSSCRSLGVKSLIRFIRSPNSVIQLIHFCLDTRAWILPSVSYRMARRSTRCFSISVMILSTSSGVLRRIRRSASNVVRVSLMWRIYASRLFNCFWRRLTSTARSSCEPIAPRVSFFNHSLNLAELERTLTTVCQTRSSVSAIFK